MVARYYRELHSLLTRTLKDRHAADDVVQEAFTRVLALRHAGRPVEKLRSVLHRTAYNLVIDASRRNKLRDHDDLDALPEHTQPAAARSSQPEERLCAAQRAQAMLATIEALPPRCREAFVLYKIDGVDQAEIARRMGISVNMVERHVMRGMDACRACRDRLDGEGEKDSDSSEGRVP
ncbi:RNA polymerase sigma factor [Variovorax sp. RCC_210]|uniref:RNA polymerase sigma factor n=1 Tax=Variovorax sp. RCC_210 TaxID=3239217 RepID=UPI003525375A